LRHLFEKGDVAGTLAMVRRWEVEAAGTYKLPPSDWRYSIRFANTGTWEDATGFNNPGLRVSVTP
jgi:hypothetical protein